MYNTTLTAVVAAGAAGVWMHPAGRPLLKQYFYQANSAAAEYPPWKVSGAGPWEQKTWHRHRTFLGIMCEKGRVGTDRIAGSTLERWISRHAERSRDRGGFFLYVYICVHMCRCLFVCIWVLFVFFWVCACIVDMRPRRKVERD